MATDDQEALESLVQPGVMTSEKRLGSLLRLTGGQRRSPRSTQSGQLRHCSTLTTICLTSLLCGVFLGAVGGSMLDLKVLPLEGRARHPVSIYGHSPAYEAIASRAMVRKRNVHVGPNNPYSGAPSPETDAKWKDLLRGYNIRTPRTSLNKDPGTVIPMQDESGDVWASFGVYHHLHCLDSLRHQISGQDCISHDSKLDDDGFPVHLDHCIETLRQWLMCLPDLTPRSVIWREDGLSAKANNTIVHTCVDWDAVQSWVDDHVISGARPVLKTPNGNLFDGPWPPPPRCAGF